MEDSLEAQRTLYSRLRARILVVDDDPLIVKITAFLLRDAGYRVFTAHDGQTALDVLGRQPVDLVLLDVLMPGLDGYEVCRQIRSQADTPVVFVSAKVETEDRIRGLEVGADDYLVKPYGPAELLARVQAVLRRSYAPLEQTPEEKVELPQEHPAEVAVIEQYCPHLGLHIDRASVASYPTTAHRCYAMGPAVLIDADRQKRYCLGPTFPECSYFQTAIASPAPYEQEQHVQSDADRRLRALALTLVSALIVILLYVWRTSTDLTSDTQAVPAVVLFTPTIERASPVVGVEEQAPTPTAGTPFSPREPVAVTRTRATEQPVQTEGDLSVTSNRPGAITETIAAQATASGPTATETAVPSPTTAPTAAVTARIALNVRNGPDTTYPVVHVLLNGDTVTIAGQNVEGDWLHVFLPDGTSGWISRQYTDFDDTVPAVAGPPTNE